MTEFLQQIVNGLAAGAIYALIAVGYSLVYGILELINFTHGDIYMFSTFICASLILAGVPLPFALLGALVSAVAIGLAVERFAYRPLRTANRIAPTITAVGAALILENVAQLIWGPQTHAFPFAYNGGVINLGGVFISELQVIVLVVAALMAAALYVIVQHTSFGRAMRAIRDDHATAELTGIRTNRTVAMVYAMGSALGLVGGVLFASYYNAVYVGMGFTGTMNAFAAAVLGGIGSLAGAFVGGLTLGVLQALAVGYIASGYQNTVAFVIMIAVLLIRPSGLFSRPTGSRV